MPAGLRVLLAWSAFVILTGFLFLLWGLKTHQFRNVEEPKYTMLDDREPRPWHEDVEGIRRRDRSGGNSA